MPGEYSPEYSDLSPKLATPFEANELLTRKNHRVRLEMGARALQIEGFTVLDHPETAHKQLETYLKSSIIGQDQAIDAIIDAMDRSRVRLVDNPRPLATLAFLGPTGVGKSETAKLLADYRTGRESGLVKIDCSNFSHGHEVASLIGSPPGYVGHDQQPFLNKKRVEQPGTVVLFDEIEKGSAPLYNLMLQILGDGELQLNDGTTTSFRDATVILTSNLGAKEMNSQLSKNSIGFGIDKEEPSKEALAKSAKEAFKSYFSPEFVNRIDSTVVFNPLDREGLGKVLDNKLAEANEEYVEEYGMAISFTPAVYDFLIDKALQERGMGARPLVRAFEKDIQSTFGRYVSGPQLFQGSQINVYHATECPEEVRRIFPDDELIFTHRYDQELWNRREKVIEELREEKRQRDEERRKEEDKKKAQVVFDDGRPDSEPTPPEDAPQE